MRGLAVAVVAVLAVILVLGLSGFTPPQFAVIGYASEIPIQQLGYSETNNYWILTAAVNEQEAFKLVLHRGDEAKIGADKVAKAKSEVSLVVEPLNPISTAQLVPTDIKWLKARGYFFQEFDQWEKAPVFDVEEGSWLTQARYSLTLYKNGAKIDGLEDVRISYKDPRVLTVGGVTVNNLGILPQGVEVPSGDLVVVYDGYRNKHLVYKSDLLYLIDRWNEMKRAEFPVTESTWGDLWEWGRQQGILPKDVALTHVGQVKYEGDEYSLRQITLIYSDIAFSGLVTLYIPSSLADTVILVLYMPKPVITSVSQLPDLKEGESATITVEVKNEGTAGTVSVTAQSLDYMVIPLTSTMATLEEGETMTVQFKVIALSVDSDKEAKLEINAQGRGGADSRTLTATIKDVPGYTPPEPEPPTQQTALIEVKASAVNLLPDPFFSPEIRVDGQTGRMWFGLPCYFKVNPGTYTVTFQPVNGYITPAPQTIKVLPGETVTVTGTYIAYNTIAIAATLTITVIGIIVYAARRE